LAGVVAPLATVAGAVASIAWPPASADVGPGVLVDAARYVAIVAIVLLLLGTLQMSRSEAARVTSFDPHAVPRNRLFEI
jgi:uncharacterized membrane protein YgdD (TMEM256/DUF423 family)